MTQETVIDVLDRVFNGREFDLSLLSNEELLHLSEELTTFAINYKAPPRHSGTSRFYGGGIIWNNTSSSKPAVFIGPYGLFHGTNAQALQTLCLAHDSVVCHDAVTDLLSASTSSFFPSFYQNLWQGEDRFDDVGLGQIPVTTELRAYTIQRANPILRVYDRARPLIQKGYLIPVPTKPLLIKHKHQILTQLRHSHRDSAIMELATQTGSVGVTDVSVSLFMQPIAGNKININNASNNPNLRLHYGMLHHLKCLSVAFQASADFVPTDDFGWGVLNQKYDELHKILTRKSKETFYKHAAQSALMIPLVKKFSIDDIVSIRTNEDVFEELRKLLRSSVGNFDLAGRSLPDFYRDFEEEKIEALANWKRRISAYDVKKNLFKDIALTTSGIIGVGTSLLFLTDSPAAVIASVSGLSGIYYGLKDLLFAGSNPKNRLIKILRRYQL